jgi:uncharacterized membrane protein YpjA
VKPEFFHLVAYKRATNAPWLERLFNVGLNRYPSGIIGVSLTILGRVFSLTWRKA